MSSLVAAPYDLPTGADARTLLLQRTASGIEDLLEQASDHVTASMQQFDREEQRRSSESSSGGAVITALGKPARRLKNVRTILVAILRRSFRGKSARKEESSLKRADVSEDEYHYRRLWNGFTGLFEHVQALDKSREGLKRAVVQLRASGNDLDRIAREVAERENGDDRIPASVAFASYESALSDVVATLDERVAPITQTKLLQLQHFQARLDEREALRCAVHRAQQQLCELQDALSDGKKGVSCDQVRAADHAFHRLRRRLEAMTAAVEHVFRFHYQLDQCVADPELRIVHHALSQLFARCLQTFD